jgi:hypothetical protein
VQALLAIDIEEPGADFASFFTHAASRLRQPQKAVAAK